MKIIYILLVLLIFIPDSSALIINEIMADPIADETLNEWIELYNDENIEINASNWVIGDGTDNDTIEGGLYSKEGTIIGPFGFAIITDDNTRAYNNFNVSQDALRLYIDDGSIGNGLSNDGETIYLFDASHNLIDKKEYNKTKEGLSWALLNGTLAEAKPSPGYNNNGSSLNADECDYSIDFILSKPVFDNASDFSFQARASKISGTSTNFSSFGKIEDFNGRVMQEYKFFSDEKITTQRTSSKYSPNLNEGKSYILSANLSVLCNDEKLGNNLDVEIITIQGKPLENNSFIKIEQVYDLGPDKTAKFGDTIRIKLNAYRGNTNKESIAVWIEDEKNRISKESRTSLLSKYTNYSLIIPIQIKPNCDEKFDDDKYSIIAEGLGNKDEEDIGVEGLTSSMCKIKTVMPNSTSGTNKKFEFELKTFNEKAEAGKVFETEIFLANNDGNDLTIKIWSYAYRGSKSYSGERESNMKELVLKAHSSQIVELSNKVKADPGNYKFKVLVNKNNQKTNNQITRDIAVESAENTSNSIDTLKNKNNNFVNKETEKSQKMASGNLAHDDEAIYESNTQRAKSFAPIFLAVLSIVLNIILIWRK